MAVSIQIKENVSQMLESLRESLTDKQLATAAGVGVQTAVRRNFLTLEGKPNKQGFPKTHFWNDAAKSTLLDLSAANSGRAIISINKIGVALQRFGGTVRPVNKKWLTISATSESYGHTASEFPDLQFRQISPVLAMLIRGQKVVGALGRVKRKQVQGPTRAQQVLFWLVKKAVIGAHPETLPTDSQMQDEAAKAVESKVLAEVARANK
jgi:hypothetical protein